ncbi:hypothetical protein D3C80_2107900 [compost metagenome]
MDWSLVVRNNYPDAELFVDRLSRALVGSSLIAARCVGKLQARACRTNVYARSEGYSSAKKSGLL